MATTDKKITLTFEVSGNGATMLKQIDGEIKKFSLNAQQAKVAAKNFGTTVEGLSNVSVKQSSLEFQKLSGTMGGFSDSTGIASAGALELGRVISDLPYGIKGVANNLSQLSSNILFAATKIDKATGVAIGFSGAIKGIWKSLMGPLGLLLAIQSVIAAFEFFSNRQEKAKDDVDKLNVSIDKQVNKLGILQEMLSQEIVSGSFGSKEFNEKLEVLVDKFSEFGLKYKELTDEQKKDSSFIRNLIESYQSLLVVRNRIKEVEKEIGDIQAGNTEEQYEGQLELKKKEALMLMSMELRLKKEFEKTRRRGREEEAVSILETYDLTNIENAPEIAFEKAKNDTMITMMDEMAQRKAKMRMAEETAVLISEDFKKKMAESTLHHAKNIYKNLQGLAGKNKALRAAFIIAEKGAAIGEMFINYNKTKMANQAYAALLPPPANQAYLKGANALARVNLVGSIASTVAQTSKALSALGAGSAGGAPSVSGDAGSQSREFDFNLVGSTAQNQLAEGIAGQFGQPIQAYVVSTQMSSQQQLDNIIQSSATLGDDGDD